MTHFHTSNIKLVDSSFMSVENADSFSGICSPHRRSAIFSGAEQNIAIGTVFHICDRSLVAV